MAHQQGAEIALALGKKVVFDGRLSGTTRRKKAVRRRAALMPSGPLTDLLWHVRRFVGARGAGDLTDRQLLERFASHQDESAFEALVQRHAPLVYGVCLRVLNEAESAADAFQATFLVLARKAASIRKHEALGSWLHGVAARIALKARSQAARRRARERLALPMPVVSPETEAAWRELRLVLDEEVQRLPDKYRVPIVLCYLEGKTYEETARQLGWTKGTVSGRLARARDLLEGRLLRRGVSLAAAGLAAVAERSLATTVPSPLVGITVQAAMLFAAHKAAAGPLSAPVAELAEGALHTMFVAKMRIAAIVLLAVALLVSGAGVLGHRALAVRAAHTGQPDEALPAKRDDGPPKEENAPAKKGRGQPARGKGGPKVMDELVLETSFFHRTLELPERRRVNRISLRVTLDNKDGGKGTLVLDPNNCGYNKFGDVTMQTLIGIKGIEVTLERVKRADPGKKGRLLYELKGKELKTRWFFVYTPLPAEGPYRLLTADNAGDVTTVFQLHHMSKGPQVLGEFDDDEIDEEALAAPLHP
jgi:RNA polymerase sigma factor (sigma-70 family)